MIPKSNSIKRLNHPPSLTAYGVVRSPMPHRTFVPAKKKHHLVGKKKKQSSA